MKSFLQQYHVISHERNFEAPYAGVGVQGWGNETQGKVDDIK